MEMKKLRSEPTDRLSELSDSLIFNIFEFLPMKDVVRTQILSHRWENLWTITPYLDFDARGFDNCEEFRNFVNRALLCWKGQKIQKFIVSSFRISKSIYKDLNLWLRFAVGNGVEELNSFFRVICFGMSRDDYCVPKCLYSCSSLQKLSLFGSIAEINGNYVQWNQLKSLKIYCFRITQHAIDIVLSRCPVLEVFSLSFQDKDNNLSLSFRSTGLKELSVYKRSQDRISEDSKLRIWTPNVEILTFGGVPYGKCLLMNVPSKTHVTLKFFGTGYLLSTLSETLPTIRHVEGLTLSGSSSKVLEATSSNFLLSPFLGVKFLELNGSFEEHEMVGLLEIFPKLKRLAVLENGDYIDPKIAMPNRGSGSNESEKNEFIPNPSKSFLVELRTVEVTWTKQDFSIFPLIKILLKYASKLEKMVFRVRRDMLRYHQSNSLYLASRTLLKMPRSSPAAKLIIREC